MSINLIYEKQLESNIFKAADFIASAKGAEIRQTINNLFFDGGVFAPKSFTSLASTYIPEIGGGLELDPEDPSAPNKERTFIDISKEKSFSAQLGFVEGIPVIGSAIAAINIIHHLFGALSANSKLKKAIIELPKTKRTQDNIGTGACFGAAKEVVDQAINYTVHYNHLLGSALSLIPLAKPIVRLAQGIIFNIRG